MVTHAVTRGNALKEPSDIHILYVYEIQKYFLDILRFKNCKKTNLQHLLLKL